MKNTFIIALITLCAISCSQKIEADLIVTNANVYTVDSAFAKAESFAVKDGKFIAVGTTSEILESYDAIEVVDAAGATVLPGLIDGHCHFYGLGQTLQVIDLIGTKSLDEVVARVQLFSVENPEINVIRGRGWDQNDWENKAFPNKTALDKLFPTKPVVLERVDGHAYLVNQAALDLAGITIDTNVAGGAILKEKGVLTGVLIDRPQELIDAVMPKASIEESRQMLRNAEDVCFSLGLTTVNDAGLSEEIIGLIEEMHVNEDLKMRVYAMVSNTPEDIDYILKKGKFKTDRLNVRSVKVYGDGALGSRGATLKEPYSDAEGHFGAMVTPVDEINELAKKLAQKGLQMNTHAIGDSANVVVLRAYKEALKNVEDPRWKVEHAQVVSQEDFTFFNDKILPSVQPTHATSDMYWAEDRVGADRIQGAYAYKDLLKKSGIVILGTDFPVEQVSPFYTFYAAVARKDLKQYPEGGYQMRNALSRKETLQGMTIWAAYSNFEENEKGSIEPGKFADFILMNEDIMTVEEDKIPNLTVDKTYLNGELVYRSSK